jgi:hypothetical protein
MSLNQVQEVQEVLEVMVGLDEWDELVRTARIRNRAETKIERSK